MELSMADSIQVRPEKKAENLPERHTQEKPTTDTTIPRSIDEIEELRREESLHLPPPRLLLLRRLHRDARNLLNLTVTKLLPPIMDPEAIMTRTITHRSRNKTRNSNSSINININIKINIQTPRITPILVAMGVLEELLQQPRGHPSGMLQ